MDVFAALADPTRRVLLRRLAGGPRRVVDLAAEVPISRPGVSKHLRLLGEAGLVTPLPSGRETHYCLNPEALAPVEAFVAALRPHPPVAERALDALELEVRRTVRERSSERSDTHHSTEETA
ncbi:ArsR/SmtB family transcription factor [Micropruina sonneratiae]|uniref:ArsR/SmtB family transcription factor n=1 Tax=Micropruina sonneratiae TaxID=2986940 RepID=UPI002227DF3C|nr:metalloregulator ArsR/SmtB family transcription factor [Micropruina sp. KQZ13P-5]MCW3157749.1 metalloregulator ArsR/SmtB family transcription factor [Micropruina sp. KQZ13P-5]